MDTRRVERQEANVESQKLKVCAAPALKSLLWLSTLSIGLNND